MFHVQRCMCVESSSTGPLGKGRTLRQGQGWEAGGDGVQVEL